MELQKLKGENVSSLNEYCIILNNSTMKLKYGNIEQLEQKLGKPVVTSNQATFAECLRIMGVAQKVKGSGSLFEQIL